MEEMQVCQMCWIGEVAMEKLVEERDLDRGRDYIGKYEETYLPLRP